MDLTFFNLLKIPAVLLMGCLPSCYFPAAESRAKAKAIDEQGFHLEAEREREKAERESSAGIDLRKGSLIRMSSDSDPRNDGYHFPELQNKKDEEYRRNDRSPREGERKTEFTSSPDGNHFSIHYSCEPAKR